MKKTMKKSTKGFLNNLVTYAIVIIAFVFTQMALSKMIPGVTISRSLKGQLIPICVYIVMAVSLNLTVGISGELSLCGKALIKTVEHLIERPAELSEFRQDLFGNLHICQIIRLNPFHLRCKRAQGLKRMPA